MKVLKHPETVLVKNEFYPKGLKEMDSWTYYQSVQNKLLSEISGRDLMIFIATGVNETTVLRRGKTTNFIRLNRSNWDDTFHARMLSIISTMHQAEDFAIIDVDTIDFRKAKEATLETYNFVVSSIPFVDSAWIKYTGKNSFHVVCNLKREMYVDQVKILLRHFLEKSDLRQKYSIDDTRRRDKSILNLDLSSMKWRGGFVSLHSLSALGLRCMKVNIEKVRSFKKEDAVIKTV